MSILAAFLFALFALVAWLLVLAYRETEQDFPTVHRRLHR